MNLGQTFNTNELPVNSGFDPIPAGEYSAAITGAELKNTKNGDGQYIAVQYTITGPTHEGRVIFSNLNIRNKNPKAQEIGLAGLNSLMRAIGLASISDTDQLVGGNMLIKVKLSPAKDGYDASNDVTGWKALAQPSQMPKQTQKSATPPWLK